MGQFLCWVIPIFILLGPCWATLQYQLLTISTYENFAIRFSIFLSLKKETKKIIEIRNSINMLCSSIKRDRLLKATSDKLLFIRTPHCTMIPRYHVYKHCRHHVMSGGPHWSSSLTIGPFVTTRKWWIKISDKIPHYFKWLPIGGPCKLTDPPSICQILTQANNNYCRVVSTGEILNNSKYFDCLTVADCC